ncbi:hypothetical protein EZV73_04835 [Acidaminobacter sp. JC074]|uniref:hypothetical protein n=1 Tax=Acidaminobacter sp. JC074 TaxID=2530199 RepID=UPI001F0EFBB5|nr:hypothetical protein [Acidaminobacter sp. JC074]MCH4886880.1 hypothetical protein [Acidaminobacter sp. JC074]
MMRKFMILLLILIMALSANIMVFANDETSEEYVHIISPEVGESGKMILNEALFISIYVQTDDTMYLNLKKVVPSFNFDEEAEEKEYVEMIPLVPALPVEEVEVEEEKISLAEVEIIEEEPLTKDEVVASYTIAEDDFKIVEEELANAKAAANIETFVDETSPEYDPSYQLTEEDIEAANYLDDVTVRYNEALANYEKWKKEYDKLFEEDVFEKLEMVVDSSLPYFEHTVSDVEPGSYKLIVTNDLNEIVEQLDFEVVSEQVIADKIIENTNVFENIIDNDVFNSEDIFE